MIFSGGKKLIVSLLTAIGLVQAAFSFGSGQTGNGWVVEAIAMQYACAGLTMVNSRVGIIVNQSPLKTEAAVFNGIYEPGMDKDRGTNDNLIKIIN